MSLLEMSFAGGVLILAVIVLRALALDRLPKGTFLALWGVAVLRLLVPFSIPSPVSVYTLAERIQVRTAAPSPAPAAASFPSGAASSVVPAAVPAAPEAAASVDPLPWVWCAGMLVCGAYFLVSYLRCRRAFSTALPVEDPSLLDWAARQRRRIVLRQCGGIRAPLTYGLLRPVILLPKGWTDDAQMEYALAHELAHIRHLDALWKPLLAFTACVHWFNPLVWCMLALANRDMELRCDEAAVRRLGLERRSGYALALIALEEKKSGLGPFSSAFSKNDMEERIFAIMKLKKRSLAAVLAAVVLVCCIGAGFATSAAVRPDTPRPTNRDGFTQQELDRLASLWFEGWEDMTVTAYQQKMWTETDTPEMIALIDRYANGGESSGSAFDDYFYQVFSPLTAENWRSRDWDAAASTGLGRLEYGYSIDVTDPDTLTAGDYQRLRQSVEPGVQEYLRGAEESELETAMDQLFAYLSEAYPGAEIVQRDGYIYVAFDRIDEDLYAQFSREAGDEWDRLLAPYAAFGLSWEFNDPDLDGNGLTMWFEGKEVCSIYDEQEGVWIAEHIGDSFPADAVDLYAVYTDGVLSGLRLSSPEEQAQFDADRSRNSAALPADTVSGETREYPRATQADYDAFLTLHRWDDETLESFNQRLLDWGNEDTEGAWDRISCDVIWDDYGVELEPWEKQFAALTCLLSGRENAAKVRALHTGGPEDDPRFFRDLPMKVNEEDGSVNAWCSLYYDLSYHIVDKSRTTVRERDAVVGGMMNAIDVFWRDTELEALLSMTEEDVVSWLNAWAAEASTENVIINPVTADEIAFEAYDERGME